MRRVLAILREEPRYARLLTASLISGIGDWFNSVAVLSLLLSLTHSGIPVAITLALRSVPYLILGPLAGVLADRLPRKVILVGTDLLRALLALAPLWVHTASDVWIVYVATFALVSCTVLYDPARTAIIPQLIGEEHLVVANGLQESAGGVVMAIGALASGVITAQWGVQSAFIVNSASFLASALLCITVALPGRPQNASVGNQDDHSAAAQPGRAHGGQPDRQLTLWEMLRTSRIVRAMTALSLLWPIGGGAINVLLSVYAFQVFHAGNFGVGVLYGALGVGFVAGGLLAPTLTKWEMPAIVVGLILEGACHIGVSQSPSLWSAALLLLCATIGAGISNASLNAMVMRDVPQEVQGRVFSLFGTTSSVMMGISMLTAGVLLPILGPRSLGFTGGLLMLVAGALSVWILRVKPVYS